MHSTLNYRPHPLCMVYLVSPTAHHLKKTRLCPWFNVGGGPRTEAAGYYPWSVSVAKQLYWASLALQDLLNLISTMGLQPIGWSYTFTTRKSHQHIKYWICNSWCTVCMCVIWLKEHWCPPVHKPCASFLEIVNGELLQYLLGLCTSTDLAGRWRRSSIVRVALVATKLLEWVVQVYSNSLILVLLWAYLTTLDGFLDTLLFCA